MRDGKMLLGLAGPAGSGKDTIADHLVSKHGFVKMANADLLKRVARDVFAFSDDQLWGPSERRNAPDKRYERSHTWVNGACACCGHTPHTPADSFEASAPDYPPCFLTPRFVLQSLGTEWGRMCFENVWIGRLLGLAQELQAGGCHYSPQQGLFRGAPGMAKTSVVIPDVRFRNEVDAIRAAGGKVVRVVRGMIDLFEQHPADGGWISEHKFGDTGPAIIVQEHTSISRAAAQHRSETELLTIPREKFDFIFQNSGDLHFLRLQAERMMDVLRGRLMAFDAHLQNAPPFLRDKCRELHQTMLRAWPSYGTPQPGDPPPEVWAPNTEVQLWTDLQELLGRGGTAKNPYEEVLLKLKELSDSVNGWFSWQDKAYDAPYFVRRGDWLEEYAKRRS